MSRWWQPRTLRRRLAFWYSVGGTLLVSAFSATLYYYVHVRMARPLAFYHRSDLEIIKRQLVVNPDGALLWGGQPIQRGAAWPSTNPWFQIWDADGRLVRGLWPYAEDEVRQVSNPPIPGRETLSVFNITPEIQLRVLSLSLAGPNFPSDWMIRIIRVHEPLAEPLRALRLIIFVALPIVVVLLVLIGIVLTRRWLKPLDHMVAEANRISADDLSRRLPVHDAEDELGRLASVFNVTLDRLEQSFQALDRFVADASHELRTPLTTLRSVGEVGLRRGRTVEEYREIIGSMLEEAQRLQMLIQRLLELATAEGGAAPAHRTDVKLDEFVAACAGELGILAEARGQQIAIETEPCVISTDAVILRQALQNLVDNAIKYSPEESTIRITVKDTPERAEVAVIDAGAGISVENRTRLTERFFRPDRARGRHSGGYGLGLSITKAYMRVLGGTLSYEPGEPAGSTFRLSLPKR